MIGFSIAVAKRVLAALLYGVAGGSVLIIALFAWYLDSRPDLEVWHLAALPAEFEAGDGAADYAAYLALEERLFAQVRDRVRDKLDAEDRRILNRFRDGSLADPALWPIDWNRSFTLPAAAPRAGVLLLHGMSDSPYSLRTLGERLQREGATVLGLRLPGHGTAPSGLVDVRWQDMAAAVRLAMRHLDGLVDGAPLLIVGYSNGGALAINYALTALAEPALPPPAGLVLVSPAIGVAPVAALAVWQARLGHLLGLDKLAWASIEPEYDPFKYNSFAVNAGDQVFRLTREIRRQLGARAANDGLRELPPILAFQSAVDATVSVRAVIDNLFLRLPPGGHELVLFDVNRLSLVDEVLLDDPKPYLSSRLAGPPLPFALRVLGNVSDSSAAVIEVHRAAGATAAIPRATGLSWPRGVYSLSHVALPFAVDDPLYGRDADPKLPGIHLGRLELRGERGVLQVSASEMLRLRWNPFHDYLEARLLSFFARIVSGSRAAAHSGQAPRQ